MRRGRATGACCAAPAACHSIPRLQGRALQQEFWWQGFKAKACIFSSLLLIMAVVVVILACYSGGTNRCLPRKAAA